MTFRSGITGLLALTVLALFTMGADKAYAACAAPAGVAGDMVYNSAAKVFQYCNDTAWVGMNKPGTGAGGCAAPAKAEGQVVFNADARVVQGCAGNGWRAFGPPGGSNGNDWVQVSAGFMHSCGIKSDGTAWCWGSGSSGQLGHGSSPTIEYAPVAVSGGGTWKTLSSGSSHTCGIKSDDTAWCWGADVFGEVGNGASGTTNVPVQISGGGAWKAISSGQFHTCGIKSDDTAWCWGLQFYGALGNGVSGAFTSQQAPVAVNGGATWKAITAGDNFSCGIKSDDTVWCWGQAADGRLGNSNAFGPNQSAPVAVSGGFTWKAISSKGGHTCAIRSNDAGYCWGYGSYGQRGDGTTGQAGPAPIAISGGASWKKIDAGHMHSCGIKADDSLWCWGYNGNAQIGDGTTTNRSSPTSVTGGGSWRTVTTGRDFSCGVKLSGGPLYCWGTNTSGQIGAGPEIGNRDAPSSSAAGILWKAIAAGQDFVCAIKTDNTAWCWGRDANQQLGNGVSTASQSSPVAVTGGASWKAITAGYAHTCGIKSDDTLWCWGYDGSGQVGNGATTGDQADPVAVSGGGTWKAISAGLFHTCGIKSDDTAWCWGWDTSGVLGNGATTGDQAAPVAVTGGGTWKTISSGYYNACGIKSDDTLWCWGNDANGQVGNGATTGDQVDPVAVTGGGTWKMVSAGQYHVCGIKSDDTLWCWGYDGAGQVGNGATTGDQVDPVAVSGGGAWKFILSGSQTSCGIKSDDTLWCWGSDTNYLIGNGPVATNQTSPVAIGTGLWGSVSIANANPTTVACGLSLSGEALCWGLNGYGQLGLGVASYLSLPTMTLCGGPTGKAGALKYNSDFNVMQYCDGAGWVGIKSTAPAPVDPCAGSPATGTVCSDGTVYAGLSPDGNVAMFTTPADAGGFPWNNGNAFNNVATGQTSLVTGASNTAAIISIDSDSGTAGVQPQQAAQYCSDLASHGHTDWYLPALNEMNILYANRVAIGGFSTNRYWSSSESIADSAMQKRFSDGTQSGHTKGLFYTVRCTRK